MVGLSKFMKLLSCTTQVSILGVRDKWKLVTDFVLKLVLGFRNLCGRVRIICR